MKFNTCWTKMISSINFLNKKNNSSKPTNSKENSKLNQKTSKAIQKTSKFSEKTSKIQQNPNQNTNKILTNAKENMITTPQFGFKDLKGIDALCETPKFKQPSKISQRPQTDPHQEQPGETDRNFIASQTESQNPGQSDQNSIPTQKSSIIMNDIGKDIDHNQNNFLFDENENYIGNFSEVYERVKLIKTSVVYEEYLVRKKTTGEMRKAFVMKPYETFIEQWNVDEEEGIEKYSDLYERGKHHVKNLIIMTRKNCRHIAKLLDYEMKPPTINTNNGNKFVPGSIAVVFETIDGSLEGHLQKEGRHLSRADKKVHFCLKLQKLIFEITTCLCDIHKQNMTVKNLSIECFGVDRFGNIKFNSVQVEDFDAKFYQCEDMRSKQNLVYMSPQELDTEVKSNRIAEGKTFFCSGFSQISDFDKAQTTPEKENLWKLGVICCKILSGEFMFEEATVKEQRDKIKEGLEGVSNSGHFEVSLKVKLKGLSLNELRTVESLLRVSPSERMSCKELLETEYLTNILEDSDEDN